MIKENAIYRYDKMNNLWCCHGIVYTRIIDGELWALDTYYNADFTIKYDEHQKIWRGEDIDETDLEFVMMIDDAIEVKENEWWLYQDEHKLYIPTGSWRQRYLVNKNYNKDNELILDNLKYNKTKIENEIKSLSADLDNLNEFIKLSQENDEYLNLYNGDVYMIRVALNKIRELKSK